MSYNKRQQLWNYMRLTKISIGILYNFAPVHDQCERYYLDNKTGNMYAFWKKTAVFIVFAWQGHILTEVVNFF